MSSEQTNKNKKLERHLMPYGKVLIVDDVKHNHFIAKSLMNPYKLQIETALSGFEAIENVNKGESYDIIFMDQVMPDMDGIETTKQLREIGYSKPIIALTANATENQADSFIQNGFDDFITKPLDTQRLDMILNKHIRDKQEQDADAGIKSIEDTPDEINIQNVEKMTQYEINGIDIVKGLERYYNNTGVYLNVLHSYVSNVNFLLDNIESQLKNDISNYIVSVHGIKGASYSIFAEELSEAAEKLEDAAENADYDFVQRENPGFMEKAKSLMNDLMDFIAKMEHDNPKPLKKVPDPELLSKLCEACKLYDMRKAEAAMAEIDKYNYEEDDGLVNWLRERVNIMQYKQILKRLTEV